MQLTDNNNLPLPIKRRNLIPIWMKPFIFLFLLFGITGLYGIWQNIMGNESESTIYGLEAFTVFSALGVFLKCIMFFKAVTAFGLWMGKDWAIKLGIIDAVVGLIVCVAVMVILPFTELIDGIHQVNFRFEVLLLIPYLIQLLRMRKAWDDPSLAIPTLFPQKPAPAVPVMPSKPAPVHEQKKEETIDKEDHSRFMPK